MRLVLGDPVLFGEPAAIGAESGDISVRMIPKEDADEIVGSHHYSHTVVWSSSEHFGVYYDGNLIGALQYGPAMNPASGERVVAGSTPSTWLELNRMWLDDDKPTNTATRAIAGSLRVIHHNKPQTEWVQAFADERCGKLGAVYQAASFLYLGEHTSTFYEIDGVWIHKSMLDRPPVDKRGWRSGPKVAWAKQNADRAKPHRFRQFRYIRFLNRKAARRLLMPTLAYPKP